MNDGDNNNNNNSSGNRHLRARVCRLSADLMIICCIQILTFNQPVKGRHGWHVDFPSHSFSRPGLLLKFSSYTNFL